MNASMPICMARALASFAPASSVVHQIVRADDRALQADRDYIAKVNSGEFELRRYEKALSDQIKHPLFGEQP